MTEVAEELKALREEVAELRKELKLLREAVFPLERQQPAWPVVPGAPGDPVFTYWPPVYQPNTSAAPWKPAWEVTCAADPTPGAAVYVDSISKRRILGDPAASFVGYAGDGGTEV